MIKKLLSYICLTCMSLVLFSCKNQVQEEFNSITNSKKSDVEIVRLVKEFEIKHPKHFESKLLLAEYFISVNDVDNAYDYLKRAEVVKKYADKKQKDSYLTKMYGYLATIEFSKKEYDAAETYIKNAINYDKQHTQGYEYMLGHLQVIKENNEQALKLFDDIYSNQPELATASDLQTYMYLLADAERYEDCTTIINKYMATGQWFAGLGSFASTVFEKDGMLQESLLCAFLEYEYNSSMTVPEDAKFLKNIDSVEQLCKENGTIEIVQPVLSLIRNLYTNNENVTLEVHDNFISKYLIIRNKINSKTVTENDFQILLSLEPYFRNFPIYYWSVWECVKVIDSNQLKNFVTVLKKAIALSPTSALADTARNEIKDVFGVASNEKIDLDLLLF